MVFTDLRLNTVYRDLSSKLSEKEARLILTRRTPYDWGDLATQPDILLKDEQIALILADMHQRQAGVPLSRVYGEQEFWGLSFLLSPDTLDPRSDTETIIDLAKLRFREKAPERILDLGTGSGCLLIALLHEFKSSFGFGLDLSFDALQMARRNANRNHVADRSVFCCANWTQPIAAKFDLIVSNPPYISNQIIPELDPEVRNHDPILALDGGEDGLKAYRQIFSDLNSVLLSDGIALFEIGYDQGESVMRLAGEYGFLHTTLHRDLAGLARVVEISRGDKFKKKESVP